MSVFAEVVRAGSFVGAARRLGLTSSGISRKISRFEDRLGVRLFNRTTRALSLTEAGEMLFEQCTEILASIEAAEDAVREISSKPRGLLRVAASDALSIEILVPFLKTFSEQYQDLSTTLVHGDGAVNLLNERVDLALLFKKPSETSFIARKLIDDPWVICASPDYLSENGSPATPDELLSHRCLTTHARGVTNDEWAFEDESGARSLQVKSVFSGIGLTVREAALQGLGVARLANFLVRTEINEGRLVPLLTDYIAREERAIYAVYPNRQHLPSKVRLFVDSVSDYMKNVIPTPPR